MIYFLFAENKLSKLEILLKIINFITRLYLFGTILQFQIMSGLYLLDNHLKQETQVINVKRYELRVLGYDDIEHWLTASPDHLYIGRSLVHYIKGTVGTKWSIPFKPEKYGKLDDYSNYRS